MKKKEGPLTREDKLRAIRTLLQLVIDSELRASGQRPAIPPHAGDALDDDGFLDKCARSLVARARAGEHQLAGAEFGTAYAELMEVAQGLPQKLRTKAKNDVEGALSEAARQALVAVRAITHEAVQTALTPAWARELIDHVSTRNQGDRAIENAVAGRLKALLEQVPEPRPSWETIISLRAVARDKEARPGSAIRTKAHMHHVREKTLSLRVPPVAESLVLTLEALEAPQRLQNLVTEALSKWREETFPSLGMGTTNTAQGKARSAGSAPRRARSRPSGPAKTSSKNRK